MTERHRSINASSNYSQIHSLIHRSFHSKSQQFPFPSLNTLTRLDSCTNRQKIQTQIHRNFKRIAHCRRCEPPYRKHHCRCLIQPALPAVPAPLRGRRCGWRRDRDASEQAHGSDRAPASDGCGSVLLALAFRGIDAQHKATMAGNMERGGGEERARISRKTEREEGGWRWERQRKLVGWERRREVGRIYISKINS